MLIPLNAMAIGRRWLGAGVVVFGLVAAGFAAEGAAAAEDDSDDDQEDVTKMAAFNVQADRVEEFGFRVGGRLRVPWGSATPYVRMVYPNTAAAKAGLRPGDRVLKTDGRSAAITLFSLSKWRKLHAKKWAEVAAGKKSVTWTLEVESPDRKERRTVKMVVPTAPPRWGATKWQPPEGRTPAVVAEAGPLAELARAVMDNGIWVTRGREALMPGPRFSEENPFVGYLWNLQTPDRTSHRIFVSQQTGRTEIFLESQQRERRQRYCFLTSPTGAMEKALRQPSRSRMEEAPLDEAREEFQKEVDFWLRDVGRVTGRWPFELKNPAHVVAGVGFVGMTGEAPPHASGGPVSMGQRADAFLKLPPATEAQRAMFAEAFGKLGAEENRWAYTETSRGLEDKRVTVVRVDPSKPDNERCTLLKIDGKAPTVAEIKRWRDEGRDVSAALGDLPPIGNLVDLNDVRVLADGTTAVVFELPIRGGNPQFPAEKFQAVFRVNKAHRGFEDFAVKMRETFRVAGVVKVTEAGLEARFQTLDPAHPPQPVFLKAGGAVRVLLIKFARSFESTRTDFRRVEPTDGTL